MMSSRTATFLALCLCALVLGPGLILAQTLSNEIQEANLACTDPKDPYIYRPDKPHNAPFVENKKVYLNLYGKPCKDTQGEAVTASGYCVAPKTCKATKCAGAECKKPEIPITQPGQNQFARPATQPGQIGTQPPDVSQLMSDPNATKGIHDAFNPLDPNPLGPSSSFEPKKADSADAIDKFIKDTESSQPTKVSVVNTVKSEFKDLKDLLSGSSMMQPPSSSGSGERRSWIEPNLTDSSTFGDPHETGSDGSGPGASECSNWFCSVQKSMERFNPESVPPQPKPGVDRSALENVLDSWPEAAVRDCSSKLGCRTNNPMNVGTYWDKVGRFDTPEEGLAAGINKVRSYCSENGLCTLNQVMHKYAPIDPRHPNNNPSYYAKVVGGWIDLDPNERFNPNDPTQMAQIAMGMARFENSSYPYGPDTMVEATNIAFSRVPESPDAFEAQSFASAFSKGTMPIAYTSDTHPYRDLLDAQTYAQRAGDALDGYVDWNSIAMAQENLAADSAMQAIERQIFSIPPPESYVQSGEEVTRQVGDAFNREVADMPLNVAESDLFSSPPVRQSGIPNFDPNKNYTLEELRKLDPENTAHFLEATKRLQGDRFIRGDTLAALNKILRDYSEENDGKIPEINGVGRDPFVNAAVGGAKNSAHLSGDAIDFCTTRCGYSQAEINELNTMLRERGFALITQTHGQGPHTHASFRGKANSGELDIISGSSASPNVPLPPSRPSDAIFATNPWSQPIVPYTPSAEPPAMPYQGAYAPEAPSYADRGPSLYDSASISYGSQEDVEYGLGAGSTPQVDWNSIAMAQENLAADSAMQAIERQIFSIPPPESYVQSGEEVTRQVGDAFNREIDAAGVVRLTNEGLVSGRETSTFERVSEVARDAWTSTIDAFSALRTNILSAFTDTVPDSPGLMDIETGGANALPEPGAPDISVLSQDAQGVPTFTGPDTMAIETGGAGAPTDGTQQEFTGLEFSDAFGSLPTQSSQPDIPLYDGEPLPSVGEGSGEVQPSYAERVGRAIGELGANVRESVAEWGRDVRDVVANTVTDSLDAVRDWAQRTGTISSSSTDERGMIDAFLSAENLARSTTQPAGTLQTQDPAQSAPVSDAVDTTRESPDSVPQYAGPEFNEAFGSMPSVDIARSSPSDPLDESSSPETDAAAVPFVADVPLPSPRPAEAGFLGIDLEECSSGVCGRGNAGQVVRDIQQYMKELGYYKGDIDGIYGRQTEASVRAFQRNQRLGADGIVGPQTLDRMNAIASEGRSTNNSAIDPNVPTQAPTWTNSGSKSQPEDGQGTTRSGAEPDVGQKPAPPSIPVQPLSEKTPDLVQPRPRPDNKQEAIRSMRTAVSLADQGITALENASLFGTDRQSIEAGLSAAADISSYAKVINDTALLERINTYLYRQNQLMRSYRAGGFMAAWPIKSDVVAAGKAVLRYIQTRYGP